MATDAATGAFLGHAAAELTLRAGPGAAAGAAPVAAPGGGYLASLLVVEAAPGEGGAAISPCGAVAVVSPRFMYTSRA